MMADTTIRRVSATPLVIALREPFGISGGVQHSADNVLVVVELADGTRGYGEAAPFPPFDGETQAMACAALEVLGPAVVGLDVRSWRRIASAAREATTVASARCALEMAALDALGRRYGLPLWSLFGGAERELETDITIPTGSIDHARESAARALADGFRRLKIKVGGGSLDDDTTRVRAAHEAARACEIMLDANAGLAGDEAVELLARLDGVPIVLFEQPVAREDWAGLRQVRACRRAPVALDESARTAKDIICAIEERAVDVVNIKLMKSGIEEALRIIETARAAGLGLMIGGMLESICAISMSACLAAGLGGFAFVDLDTPLFMADRPFIGGCAQRGARMDVTAITAGHGVSPSSDARL